MHASKIVLVSLVWTLGNPWCPAMECEITRVITTWHITHILECKFISIFITIMCYMDTHGNFGSATKRILFAIRRTVLVPGVCPYISISAMMHHMHTGEGIP